MHGLSHTHIKYLLISHDLVPNTIQKLIFLLGHWILYHLTDMFDYSELLSKFLMICFFLILSPLTVIQMSTNIYKFYRYLLLFL